MKQNYWIAIVVVLVVIIVAQFFIFNKGIGEKEDEIEEKDFIELIYSRDSGFGIGITPFEIIVHDNGILEYKNSSQTLQVELSESELKSFRKLIKESDIFSFDDEYIDEDLLDAPIISLTFNINEKTKKIITNGPYLYPDMPINLKKILWMFDIFFGKVLTYGCDLTKSEFC